MAEKISAGKTPSVEKTGGGKTYREKDLAGKIPAGERPSGEKTTGKKPTGKRPAVKRPVTCRHSWTAGRRYCGQNSWLIGLPKRESSPTPPEHLTTRNQHDK